MVIDIIVILVVVLALYKGWSKGLIMSLFVLLSYAVALTCAFYFSSKVAGYFKASAGSESKWYSILAFIVVMIGAIILVRIIGKLIEKTAELMLLGLVNRILGIVVFGLVYGSLLAILVVYLKNYGLLEDSTIQNARAGSYLNNYGDWLLKKLTVWVPEIKNMFNSSKQFIEQKATLLPQ
jgi:membrane protein required for colicin V production